VVPRRDEFIPAVDLAKADRSRKASHPVIAADDLVNVRPFRPHAVIGDHAHAVRQFR
jgi:hypothetical protein